MPEGPPKIERSHDEEYIALRQQLDHILTDERMSEEDRKKAFKDYVGVLNRKREVLKQSQSPAIAEFDSLAAEAEERWVGGGNEMPPDVE